ncbi:MAG: hypothetical protein ACOYJC_03075 [Christensenellales bacterium]|jgi:hypothetical protein
MKKTISILITLCVLILVFSGCSGAADAPESTQSQSQSTAPDDQNSSQSDEPSSQYTDQGSTGTPSAGYSKYVEIKGLSYERISKKLEEHEELALSVGMAILPVVMVDLSLIPLTVLGVEGGEAALGILSAQDVKIQQNGSVYSITYKDNEGKSIEQTCEYDKTADSMKSMVMQDGKETIFFEYVNLGESYASQYYTSDTDSGDYTLITCFFDESSITAFGIETTNKKPDSIFGNASPTSEFVINDDMYFILEDNQLTVLTDGEMKTY